MKRLFILLVALVSLSVYAQDSARVVNTKVIRFAYLSYDEALKAVPGYELARQSLDNLRAK